MTAGGRDRGGDDDNGQRREELITALNHLTRRRILRLLLDRQQRLSATEVAEELDMPLGDASYHVGILRDLRTVKRVGRRQVRGALQRFYKATIEDDPPIETLLEETRKTDEAYAAKGPHKPRKSGKPRKRRKRK
jgi:DNA-binding transcriptional ArsR family regulator